jgi:hypothetical protein
MEIYLFLVLILNFIYIGKITTLGENRGRGGHALTLPKA